MIQFRIQGDEAVLSMLAGKTNVIVEALRIRVDTANLLVQQRAQQKASGGVLFNRTGKLLRSIEAIPATVRDNLIEGAVQAGGGPAFYAKFQEYGTQGPYQIVPVNAKALRFIVDGNAIFRKAVTHPGLPERSFLRSAQKELEPQIVSDLEAAVGEAAAK